VHSPAGSGLRNNPCVTPSSSVWLKESVSAQFCYIAMHAGRNTQCVCRSCLLPN
jgi:hypothetical protein